MPRSYILKGNCGGRPSEGNSWSILRTGRSGWWIETELQIRFQPNFRFRFRNLTTDDGFPKLPCLEKKAGHDEVQPKENERQRRYRKIWDMVLNDYVKG